jgi:HAE1 family hydrophobic/amphiphilic exporter-1
MKIAAVSVRRPIGTSILCLAIAVFGWVSLNELALDLLPSVDMPRISITTSYPGVAPEEMETLVTRPIEQAVSTIEGVDELRATSSEGQSSVELQFQWGKNLEEALDDVRVAIDRVRGRLPEDAETPVVFKFDISSAPIAFVGVTGAGDPRELKLLAEDALARRLERVTGVASVAVRGGRDREIRVELDEERLSALGIPADDVAAAVERENADVSAGDMLEGGRQVVIRTDGEFERPADIGEVVITVRDGRPIRVRDVGAVVDGHRELKSELWVDGDLGMRLAIYKQSGENTVEVARALREEIDAINEDYQGRVELSMLYDSSTFIESAVDNVKESALVGGALATLVLLLFLGNLRATIVVALTIPLSVLATFGLMYFTDITLNLISFGGLALGVGNLVDCSIVILESIHQRRQDGLGAEAAAIEGTREVGPPVIAGTLTTVVVFLPVVFIGGFAGVFFGEMATVVSFSQGASLVLALTLVPMLAAKLLGGSVSETRWHAPIGRALVRLENFYGKLVAGALTSPVLVLLLAVTFFAASIVLVPAIGFELMPESDEGRLDVDVELAVGTPLEETSRVLRDIEERARSVVEPEELQHLVTSVGPEGWRPGSSNEGEVDVFLVPASERERPIEAVIAEIRRVTADVPGADIQVRSTSSNFLNRIIRRGADRLSVEIRGHDLDTADELAERVIAQVRDVNGVTHARPNRELGQLERVLRVDRARAAELGLSGRDVADAVEHYVLGRVATRFHERGNEYDVRIVLEEEDRRSVDQLTDLPVLTATGTTVPLGSLVRIEERRGPSSISRVDQERVLLIDVGTADRPLDELAASVEVALAGLEVPDGFSVDVAGELEQQEETYSGLLLGILLALFLVYAVMAMQFESLRHPLVVMIAVPFAFVGVVASLVVTSTTFNMNSFLGAIVLVGIVVNNAIVLIDYTNLLRRERGMELHEAVVTAARRRLRPILMTTLTTVLAMIPLTFAGSEGGEVQAPLARVVVGGLSVSTVVTLFVVPCLYTLIERRLSKPMATAAPAVSESPAE